MDLIIWRWPERAFGAEQMCAKGVRIDEYQEQTLFSAKATTVRRGPSRLVVMTSVGSVLVLLRIRSFPFVASSQS